MQSRSIMRICPELWSYRLHFYVEGDGHFPPNVSSGRSPLDTFPAQMFPSRFFAYPDICPQAYSTSEDFSH